MKGKSKVDLNALSFSELKKVINELEKERDEKTTEHVGVYKIGKNYFIRTVTMYLLGRLVKVTDKELVLEQCSWISETGRFSDFLKGSFSNELEVEPFPEGEIIIGRGSIIDACIWNHDLLRKRK